MKIKRVCWTQEYSELLGEYAYDIRDCWCATLDDEIVGITVVGTNTYHPYNDYVKIVVTPQHRRQGIGTNLLNCIVQNTTRPLQWSVNDDDSIAISFMRKHGFECKRKCYEYCNVTKEMLRIDDSRYSLISFAQLSSAQQEKLMKCAVQSYDRSHHLINPRSHQYTVEQWFHIMIDTICFEHSYVYEDTNVFGYVMVEDEGEDAFVTYVGSEGDARNISSILSSVLYELTQQYRGLSFELDDVDSVAMLLKERILLPEPIAYCCYVSQRSDDDFSENHNEFL